jgi:tellurite resistance protein
MIIEPNKTRLSLSYKPASRSFYDKIDIDVGDLPDVIALQKPIKELEKLADLCIQELDPYSRWLGKNPGGRGSLEAIALLPPVMAMSHAAAETRILNEWLDATVNWSEPQVLKRSELIERWPSKRAEGSADRKMWVEVSKVLQMLGYGIEPDVRFQGLMGCRTDHIVLFKLGEERMETASPEYLRATMMARFGIVIAAADGDISTTEITRLADMLETKLELSPVERLRLAAHLKLLSAEGSSLVAVKKKLEGIAQSQRESIAHVATLVALADGRVTKEESANLGKIYAVLGLNPNRVYEDLHSLGVDEGQPNSDVVTVRSATGGGKGYAIPAPPKPEDNHRVILDRVRLEIKARETSEVAAILRFVFIDDQPPIPPPTTMDAGAIAGLDHAHSSLLHRLIDRTTVGRADWESWCSQSGLLPDGAIDRINEAAWDICGGPLLEGEDAISIDHTALKEMFA